MVPGWGFRPMSELDRLLFNNRWQGFTSPFKAYRPFYSSDAVWVPRARRVIERLPSYHGNYYIPPRGSPVFVNGLVGLTSVSRPRGISLTTNAVSTSKSLRAARQALPLHLYEDRRLWHPEGAAAYPVSLVTKAPRILDMDPDTWRRIHKPQRSIPWEKMARESWHLAPATTVWGWDNPYNMVICIKRKIRRELMHAFGMAGKTGFKKPTFTQFSHVRCY